MAGLLTIRSCTCRFNPYWKDSVFFLPSCLSHWLKNNFSNNSLVNIIFFYHRRVLSCVWILGPWSYGCTGIWSCSFYWRPHQVLHKTAPRWAQLLSSQKFPSQRYQMLQYFTQQQVCLLFIVYLHLFHTLVVVFSCGSNLGLSDMIFLCSTYIVLLIRFTL